MASTQPQLYPDSILQSITGLPKNSSQIVPVFEKYIAKYDPTHQVFEGYNRCKFSEDIPIPPAKHTIDLISGNGLNSMYGIFHKKNPTLANDLCGFIGCYCPLSPYTTGQYQNEPEVTDCKLVISSCYADYFQKQKLYDQQFLKLLNINITKDVIMFNDPHYDFEIGKKSMKDIVWALVAFAKTTLETLRNLLNAPFWPNLKKLIPVIDFLIKYDPDHTNKFSFEPNTNNVNLLTVSQPQVQPLLPSVQSVPKGSDGNPTRSDTVPLFRLDHQGNMTIFIYQ